MTTPKLYGRTGLTGGTTGMLDAINGARLNDGDLAIVITSDTKVYFYTLNATLGGEESSPSVICPDTSAGDKRWELGGTGVNTKLPAFLVTPASDQENIAVGSAVTVVFATEIFNQGKNFAGNTFTAPVTGKYQLNAHIVLINIDTASAYYKVDIVTSNRTYSHIFSSNVYSADKYYHTVDMGILADMDAADTVSIQVTQQGGTQQTDVSLTSYFSGHLAC